MQKKEITLVFYHIPEDLDDPGTPNVFSIPINKQAIKLKHIHQYFPLKGHYAFRFKVVYQHFIMWLDLANPESQVPLFKEKIQIKANRLSWNEQKPQQSEHPISQSVKNISKSQPLNLFDHPDEVVQTSSTSTWNLTNINLLGDHHEHIAAEVKPQQIDFFSQKKSESVKKVNLMETFGHHGDLI